MAEINPEFDSATKRVALLFLKVGGGAAWVFAYQKAVKEVEDNGRVLLPPAAISFNIVWEAIYTVGGLATWRRLSVEDRIQTIINASWLASDARWVLAARRKGHFLSGREIALAVTYQLLWLVKYPPGDAARRSALLQNLAFSGYAALRLNTAASSSNERHFTALRAVGTAVPTLTSGILRGVRPAYLIPGLGCMTFDAIRILRRGRGNA